MKDTPKHERAEATATMSRSEMAGAGKLSNISIDTSDNGGFSVRVSMKAKASSGKYPTPYVEPKIYTFESSEAMMAFVGQQVGHKAKAAAK